MNVLFFKIFFIVFVVEYISFGYAKWELVIFCDYWDFSNSSMSSGCFLVPYVTLDFLTLGIPYWLWFHYSFFVWSSTSWTMTELSFISINWKLDLKIVMNIYITMKFKIRYHLSMSISKVSIVNRSSWGLRDHREICVE